MNVAVRRLWAVARLDLSCDVGYLVGVAWLDAGAPFSENPMT